MYCVALPENIAWAQHVLKPEELELLLRAEHRPNLVLHVLGEIVRQARLPDSEIHRMDETVTFFADSIGGCERLLTTPIPLSYTRSFPPFSNTRRASWPCSWLQNDVASVSSNSDWKQVTMHA